MKKIVWYLLLFGMLFVNVQAEDISAQMESQISEAFQQMEIAEQFQFYEMAKQLTEEPESFQWKSVLKSFFKLLFGEAYEATGILVKLLLPILLFGILQAMQLKTNGQAVSNAALMACYAIICGICITVFYSIVELAQSTMVTLDVAVKGLIPVLFSVIAAGGGLTQSAVVQPSVFVASQILSIVIHQFLFPMILFSFALIVTDHFSNTSRLRLFGELIHKTIKWVLIFSLTIFVGLISLQSVAVSSFDAVKLRGAKYAVNTFVPMVGGALAESLEALGASLLLIKNTVGIAGIIGVVILCLLPAVRILITVFMFRLTAAVCQPVSDERFCTLLNSVGDSIAMMGICVLCMAMIFVFSIAVTIGTANTVFML